MILLGKHTSTTADVGLVGLRFYTSQDHITLDPTNFSFVSLDTPIAGDVECIGNKIVLCNAALGRAFILCRAEETMDELQILERLQEDYSVEFIL